MRITKYFKFAAAVCGIAIGLAACGNAPDDTATSVLRSSEGILKYVPANTPYVFATPAAMPDDVLNKLEPHINAILSSYRQIVAMAIGNVSDEMAGDSGDAQSTDRFVSVANEFMELMGTAELRAAGIPRNPRMALYGVGLLPVLRVELGNTTAFENTIARFEEKAGETMSVGTLEEQSYRYVGDDEARLILA